MTKDWLGDLQTRLIRWRDQQYGTTWLLPTRRDTSKPPPAAPDTRG
jgi:hypothetical protein